MKEAAEALMTSVSVCKYLSMKVWN